MQLARLLTPRASMILTRLDLRPAMGIAAYICEEGGSAGGGRKRSVG